MVPMNPLQCDREVTVRTPPARGICRPMIDASPSSSQIVCRSPARLIERTTGVPKAAELQVIDCFLDRDDSPP